jgi:hypothetical protein
MYMDGLDSPYIISSIIPDLSKPAFYAVVVADLGWNKGNFAPIRQYAKVCASGKGSNACVSTSPLIRNTVYVSASVFVQIACGFIAMLFAVQKFNVRLVFLAAKPNSAFGTTASKSTDLDAITVLSRCAHPQCGIVM